MQNSSDAGITTQHRFFEEPSELALPRLAAHGELFDLAFIDGDHRFEGVFIDTFYESANLCRREPTAVGSPLSKFILLRVDRRGDSRAWDHFVPF